VSGSGPAPAAMDVAVVGAGRAGTALAVLLRRAGYRIVAASGRAATAERIRRHLGLGPVPAAEAAAAGQLVLLGVPDGAIAEACAALASEGAFRQGQWVAHLSGTARLDVLGPARRAGAGVLSLHPLQTLPDVERAIERLPGSAMAVTATDEAGAALGESLARAVGARPFRLDDRAKPLYHAAAVFASNDVIVVTGLAERLFRAAGLPEPLELFAPLARTALENALNLGPAAALTGPVARGDAGTLEVHLGALRAAAPDTVPAYVALARAALDLAERAGSLPPGGRGAVEEVLARWS
jgi:predicted short-subunit dehydrogenase-like oxidoreductase (DUF2520 family)